VIVSQIPRPYRGMTIATLENRIHRTAPRSRWSSPARIGLGEQNQCKEIPHND